MCSYISLIYCVKVKYSCPCIACMVVIDVLYCFLHMIWCCIHLARGKVNYNYILKAGLTTTTYVPTIKLYNYINYVYEHI